MIRIDEIANKLAEARKWHPETILAISPDYQDKLYLITELSKVMAEKDAAEAECLEQARLNGIGAERELALMARKRESEALAMLLAGALESAPDCPADDREYSEWFCQTRDAALSDLRLIKLRGTE